MQLDTSHKDFHKLRDRDKLDQGRDTLSLTKHGKNGETTESRAKRFEAVKALLPYKYVYLRRKENFDLLLSSKDSTLVLVGGWTRLAAYSTYD